MDLLRAEFFDETEEESISCCWCCWCSSCLSVLAFGLMSISAAVTLCLRGWWFKDMLEDEEACLGWCWSSSWGSSSIAGWADGFLARLRGWLFFWGSWWRLWTAVEPTQTPGSECVWCSVWTIREGADGVVRPLSVLYRVFFFQLVGHCAGLNALQGFVGRAYRGRSHGSVSYSRGHSGCCCHARRRYRRVHGRDFHWRGPKPPRVGLTLIWFLFQFVFIILMSAGSSNRTHCRFSWSIFYWCRVRRWIYRRSHYAVFLAGRFSRICLEERNWRVGRCRRLIHFHMKQRRRRRLRFHKASWNSPQWCFRLHIFDWTATRRNGHLGRELNNRSRHFGWLRQRRQRRWRHVFRQVFRWHANSSTMISYR